MDVSRKIPKSDILALNKFQVLISNENKISQKYIIHKAIEFSLIKKREDFLKDLLDKKIKNEKNERELFYRWLNKKVKIKGDIVEEHDTVL